MAHGCDVCRSYRPRANLRRRTVTEVRFGEHTVVLCEMHRRIAQRSGVTTFEALRDFYGEPRGRRSYVPRRSAYAAPEPGVERRRRERRSPPST